MKDLRDRVKNMKPEQMRALLIDMAETAPRWLREYAEKHTPPFKENTEYRTIDGYDLIVRANLTNLKSLTNEKPTRYIMFEVSKRTLPYLHRKDFPGPWILTELQFETAIDEGIQDYINKIGRVS